jgi:predicted MFS family arabinose efflux permease
LAKSRSLEIGMLALLHSLQHVYINALPPLYVLIIAEFHISTLQIGLIGSVLGLISVLQGPAGYLVEKVGEKRLAVMSMLACSVTVFGYSLSPSFLFLLLLISIYGLSQVTFHPATYSMVQRKSPAGHQAKYIAYHQVGGFVGSAIGTGVTAYLASIYGWRTTLQILPMVGVIIILLFWKFVEDDKTVTNRIEISSDIHSKPDREPFKLTTPLVILVLGISIFSLGNLLTYIPLFLSEAYGESVAWAGILTSIMHAVGSASSLFGGVISDKFDKASIMVISHILVGIATILLAVGPFSSVTLLLMLVLYGIVRYLPVPAQHALSSRAASEHPQGIGFSYTGIALGQIFSAPLIGYLIDVIGARPAFLVYSVFPFISGAVMLVVKKWKL